MPELPEIETIKKYLKKLVKGRKILNLEIFNRKSFQGTKNKIQGTKILRLKRQGKMLIFVLDNNYYLIFHLKMTGQIIFSKEKNINKTTRAVFFLDNGYLIFNDLRKFGWIKIVDDENLKKEIAKLGIDALDLTFNDLKEIFKKTKRPIKLVLMDQKKIAGIGNIYANEALFLAKIHPQQPANKISNKKIINLLKSIKFVLKKAIQNEGTSFSSFIKPDMTPGHYQNQFFVYQRQGEKCLFCHSQIKKIILSGRSTFFCPNCQVKK